MQTVLNKHINLGTLSVSSKLTADTFTDLLEDLPDINDHEIKGTDYGKVYVAKTLYYDYTIIPQTMRDAIADKGWELTSVG